MDCSVGVYSVFMTWSRLLPRRMSSLQHKAVLSESDTYSNSKLSGCAGEYKCSDMLFAFSLVSLRGQVNQVSLIIVTWLWCWLLATTLSISTSH